MTALRRTAGVLSVALGLELVVVLVTGGESLIAPGGPHVGPFGFGVRLLAFGLAVGLRFHVLAEPGLRLRPARLLLIALLLPTLYQFQFAGGRINGDGVMYYVYVRSILKDADLDFTNEYAHYGLITRGDLAVPTRTGLRRSIFAVGPGLLAMPGFTVGELLGRLQSAAGSAVDLTGYGPVHRNGVALFNLLYGFAALVLIHAVLLRHFPGATALLATLLLWGTTFLHWYMVQQPTMSHAPSAFVAALALLLWDRWRGALSGTRAAWLGLVLGFSMCVRWQNGVLLLLPGLDLLRRVRREPGAAASAGALLGACATVGAFPQLLAWKILYGEYLLRYPPHGADFLRLDHPFLLETFFSSRHGLLAWTPALWAGYIGFLPLLARRRAVALALLPPLVVMSYVNACSGDWWAGGSFSNRRFDSLLPVFAFGMAAAIDWARRLVLAERWLALGMVAVPFATWNLALADVTQRNQIPRDDTVAFSRLVGTASAAFADRFGFPSTWPASWWFAVKEDLSPGRYDLAVGRYLFYRQNNLDGLIDLGSEEHAGLLAEGWSGIVSLQATRGRYLDGRARLLAPLDVPEALELRLTLHATDAGSEVRVVVNGREAGRLQVDAGAWQERRLAVPAAFWRRELNDVVIEATRAGTAASSVRFVRIS